MLTPAAIASEVARYRTLDLVACADRCRRSRPGVLGGLDRSTEPQFGLIGPQIGTLHHHKNWQRLVGVGGGPEEATMRSCDLHNFLGPCLLLLLAERPDHGYELVNRLRPLIDLDGDAPAIYRTLRHLEHDGMVQSQWLPANGAPSRRHYEITDAGRAALRASAVDVRGLRDTLDRFLFRQRSLATTPIHRVTS